MEFAPVEMREVQTEMFLELYRMRLQLSRQQLQRVPAADSGERRMLTSIIAGTKRKIQRLERRLNKA